jgi:hypothetical protein
VETGEIANLTPAEIDLEVRLVTAVLDPTTDVVASVTTYLTSSISRWRGGL